MQFSKILSQVQENFKFHPAVAYGTNTGDRTNGKKRYCSQRQSHKPLQDETRPDFVSFLKWQIQTILNNDNNIIVHIIDTLVTFIWSYVDANYTSSLLTL